MDADEILARVNPKPRRGLNLREARFVRYYLGPANGNGTQAAKMAGYTDPEQAAYKLMKRPHVRQAIERMAAAEAKAQAIDKPTLIREVAVVMAESKPFERLKAAELLAKLLGYFAPTHRVTENIHRTEAGRSAYDELLLTLREHGDQLTPEQRVALRRQVEADIQSATQVLALLTSEAH